MRGAVLGLALVPVACSPSAEVRFTGTEHPPQVSPEDLDLLGAQTPDGFTVIGVVTARCERYNEASGILSDPCTRDSLIQDARGKAAESGGSALVDLTCREELLERTQRNVDGGGVEITTRDRLTCQATVVRRKPGASPFVAKTVAPKKSGEAPPSTNKRRIKIGAAQVDVAFIADPGARPGPPSDAAIGELTDAPTGYAQLGRVYSECANTCSPAAARTALLKEGARIGATALAAVTCDIAGADRWTCQGLAIGAELPDAGAPDT